MIATEPDPAMPSQRAIDRLGDADRESLDTAPETAGIIRLHQQMNVIGLDTELEQTKSSDRRPS